uniref:DUF58 domain-containing protein n=1 Tax=Heterorhabditis bacteriophora TaxID=37862 RepID=A0A1I7WGI2_HETBA
MNYIVSVEMSDYLGFPFYSIRRKSVAATITGYNSHSTTNVSNNHIVNDVIARKANLIKRKIPTTNSEHAIRLACMRSCMTPDEWTFAPYPLTYHFDEIAITSTSETCNELARTRYLENHSIHGIALTLAFCLFVNEPHRGGLGGASIALYANANTGQCSQTTGYPRFPKTLLNTVKLVQMTNSLNLHGPHNIAIPGEFQTILAITDKLDVREFHDLVSKMMFDRMDIIPISHSLAKAISEMDTVFAVRPNFW